MENHGFVIQFSIEQVQLLVWLTPQIKIKGIVPRQMDMIKHIYLKAQQKKLLQANFTLNIANYTENRSLCQTQSYLEKAGT